jgi:twitching motility protein PilT
MAAIDSLLMLIEAQQASGLVLRAKEIPVLIGGKGRGLTMPPLDRQTIEAFTAEVLSPEGLASLRSNGRCEAKYDSARHGTFMVEAQSNDDNLSLKLRRGGAGLARPATAAPSTSPAAVPPSPATPMSTAQPVESEHATADPAQQAMATRLVGVIARALGPDVSDIVLSAGQPPWIRATERFAPASSPAVTPIEIRAFVDSVLDPSHRRALESVGSVDLAWQALLVDDEAPQRFRLNVFTQARGMSVALRPVSRRAPSLVDLNLPDSLESLTAARGGLVLVVGPTGSGKSSTLAALVESVNRTRERHILTIEDPIEFVYQARRCLIHQREVGTHVESFSAGLRAALRESPDIILVGEMRDRETISMALTAAETGHLVLSTLHSGSGPMAVDRIVDVFPEYQQGQIRQELAGSLRAVVTQLLLPGVLPGVRYPALELLIGNYAVGALIREGKTHQLSTQIQTGREDGMIALETSLFELVRAGRIARDVALAAARDPLELQRRLREVRS